MRNRGIEQYEGTKKAAGVLDDERAALRAGDVGGLYRKPESTVRRVAGPKGRFLRAYRNLVLCPRCAGDRAAQNGFDTDKARAGAIPRNEGVRGSSPRVGSREALQVQGFALVWAL
jgi:hypothetical protein